MSKLEKKCCSPSVKRRAIVAGSRTFNDYALLEKTLDGIYPQRGIEIISGCARGADWLGERYAAEKGIPFRRFPAEWDNEGCGAGYRRNERMAENADELVAFWDGKSPGTKHMIEIAEKRGLKVFVIR